MLQFGYLLFIKNLFNINYTCIISISRKNLELFCLAFRIHATEVWLYPCRDIKHFKKNKKSNQIWKWILKGQDLFFVQTMIVLGDFPSCFWMQIENLNLMKKFDKHLKL